MSDQNEDIGENEDQISEPDPDQSVDYEAENQKEYDEQPFGVEAEKSGGEGIKGEEEGKQDKEDGEFNAEKNDVVMEMLKQMEQNQKQKQELEKGEHKEAEKAENIIEEGDGGS